MTQHHNTLLAALLAASALIASPAAAEEDPFGDSGDDPFGDSGSDPFGDSKPDAASGDAVRMDIDPLLGRVRIGVGGTAVFQDLSIKGASGDLERTPPPHLGGALELDLSLMNIESWGATMRLLLDGTAAFTRDEEETPELNRQALTDYYQGSARLAFTRAIFKHTDLTASFGFHAASLLVEANNTFTGTRYMGAVVGLDLTQWLFEDRIGINARAAALPVIAANTSDGAEGEVDAFGWRVGGGLTWNIIPSYDDPTRTKIDLEARYTHQHFTSQYPASPRLGAADAVDMQDMFALLFHISL
jgi:hypothetical protein